MSDCNCDWETGECQGPLGCKAFAEIERLTAENNAWIDRDIERNDREAELLAALQSIAALDHKNCSAKDMARNAIAKVEGK